MSKPQEQRIFWAIYIVLVILLMLHFLPFAFNNSRLWGFNHLLFLPPIYSVIFALLGLGTLILPFLSLGPKWADFISAGFSRTFFESPRKYVYRFLFILSASVIFFVFAMPTHFLGDGYALLGNLASTTGAFVKWSEQGVIFILMAVQSLFGPHNEQTALAAFRVVSILSGAISIWFLFLIVGLLDNGRKFTLVLFLSLFATGVLLLFFGYVENYPMIWIGLTGFIYFSLLYIKTGQGFVFAALFLILGIFIHLLMGVFIPAFILLLFARGYGAKIYNRHRHIFWTAAALIILAFLIVFFRKYSSDLYFRNIFLPLIYGKPIYPVYSILSLPHILDIINLLFILAPLLWLLIPLARGRAKAVLKSKEGLFLFITALGGLGFLVIIDPTLGMPRDWDLLSASAFGFALLVGLSLSEKRKPLLNKFLLSFLVFSLATTSFGFAKNIGIGSSENYAKYTVRLDPPKGLSILVPMNNYYQDIRDSAGLFTLHSEFNYLFDAEERIEHAIQAGDRNDYRTFIALLDSIPKDTLFSRYHILLCQKAMFERRWPLALEEINKALQLQQYNFNLYIRKSLIYSVTNKFPEALSNLQIACRLNNDNTVVQEGLALMHLQNNNIDSALYYTDRLEAKKIDYDIIFYVRARSEFMRKNLSAARSNAEQYIQAGVNDHLYQNRKKEMEQILQTQ